MKGTGSSPIAMPSGLSFFKMTGSGNDFIFFDGRQVDRGALTHPEVIQAICDRHNGIGGDGLVILSPSNEGRVRLEYFNADGTPADLCGNATLCATALSPLLGLSGESSPVHLETPAGVIKGVIAAGQPQQPEIAIGTVAVTALQGTIPLEAGETRVGFLTAGIPHLVLLVENAEAVKLPKRGPVLRHHPSTGPAGANVNWVSRLGDGSFRYRTFERGVEGETLACGTGAVATAAQLVAWRLAESPVRIISSSGLPLTVALDPIGEDRWRAKLAGEGRVVFSGVTGHIPLRVASRDI